MISKIKSKKIKQKLCIEEPQKKIDVGKKRTSILCLSSIFGFDLVPTEDPINMCQLELTKLSTNPKVRYVS